MLADAFPSNGACLHRTQIKLACLASCAAPTPGLTQSVCFQAGGKVIMHLGSDCGVPAAA